MEPRLDTLTRDDFLFVYKQDAFRYTDRVCPFWLCFVCIPPLGDGLYSGPVKFQASDVRHPGRVFRLTRKNLHWSVMVWITLVRRCVFIISRQFVVVCF